MKADIVIPVYNEGDRIEDTLMSLKGKPWINQMIVVDDGSTDQTYKLSECYADILIKHTENKGKDKAVKTGLHYVNEDYVLLLDGDLGTSIAEAEKLLTPLMEEKVDMTIATFPRPIRGGCGFVKKRARHYVYKKTGVDMTSPLSGQRGIRSEWIQSILQMPSVGFGLEMSLNLTFLKKGAIIKEIETNMSHREHGKTVYGFYHRFKQLIEMEKSIWQLG
ncbi:glycosyltransferase family 2 protein [Evansella halocellulosilytica]|uniref:glycosyltransferase family 2 protein n=1 Tax=Evansella halocellulosilytica TaxID=2011013 RepID=UPI0015C8506A|nr:glycosyltransferase family 2 protein [Evansella halocellulosilytica]